MSAGMSMLMTSGLMAKVGAYAIPKKEKERRINTASAALRKNIPMADNILGKKIRMREDAFSEYTTQRRRLPVRLNYKNKIAKKSITSLKKQKKKLTTLLNDYVKAGGKSRQYHGEIKDEFRSIDEEILKEEKIMKMSEKQLVPTTEKQDRIKFLKGDIKARQPPSGERDTGYGFKILEQHKSELYNLLK